MGEGGVLPIRTSFLRNLIRRFQVLDSCQFGQDPHAKFNIFQHTRGLLRVLFHLFCSCRPANVVQERACAGGVRLIKGVRKGRGSMEKQKNADKGREGVKNPGNFADVLYEWSLIVQAYELVG